MVTLSVCICSHYNNHATTNHFLNLQKQFSPIFNSTFLTFHNTSIIFLFIYTPVGLRQPYILTADSILVILQSNRIKS